MKSAAFFFLKNVNVPVTSEEVTLALKVLTVIGCVLSMVGLILTIITMLIFKYVLSIKLYSLHDIK